MKLYFERFIVCEKCGDFERQTATELPLDRIGNELNYLFKKEFKLRHSLCQSTIRLTAWCVGKDNFRNEKKKISRDRKIY